MELLQQAFLNDKMNCRTGEWASDYENQLYKVGPDISKFGPVGVHLAKERQRYWRSRLADVNETASQEGPIAYASDELIGISEQGKH